MSDVKKTATPELKGPLGHPEKRREFRIGKDEPMVLHEFDLPVLINGVRFWGPCHVTEGMRDDAIRMETKQMEHEERFIRGGKTRFESIGKFSGNRNVVE